MASRVWIFQTSIKKWVELDNERQGQPRTLVRQVRQHKADPPAVGDLVYLWRCGGDPVGVYARGRVTGGLRPVKPEDGNGAGWSDDVEDRDKRHPVVTLEIEAWLDNSRVIPPNEASHESRQTTNIVVDDRHAQHLEQAWQKRLKG